MELLCFVRMLRPRVPTLDGRTSRASLHCEGLEEGDVGGLGFDEGLEVGLVGEVVLEVLAVAMVVVGGGLEVAFVVFVAVDEGVGEEFVAFETKLFDHPALDGDVVVCD